MKVLVFGASGQLGKHLLRSKPNDVELLIPSRFELDFYDGSKICDYVLQHEPAWVINAAAYTNVDQAETDKNAALTANHGGPTCLAWACGFTGSKLLHISTDYVFDGSSDIGYSENDITSPINHYGLSKWEGEVALLKERSIKSYILRTSWLYGVTGKNFVRTMTARALRGEGSKVVSDQIGSPTNARDLAKGIFSIVEKGPEKGIYHFSNQGSCSWFEFAQKIYDLAGANSELVQPIDSNQLHQVAKRPSRSILNTSKWVDSQLGSIPSWEISLASLMPEIISTINLEGQP
jgi:dTDP-4-dehydrorhamnose reductase